MTDSATKKPITDPFKEWSGLKVCGGIFFGENLQAQLDLASATPSRQSRHLQNTLRISCQEWSFAFIREASEKFRKNRSAIQNPSLKMLDGKQIKYIAFSRINQTQPSLSS